MLHKRSHSSKGKHGQELRFPPQHRDEHLSRIELERQRVEEELKRLGLDKPKQNGRRKKRA